MCTGEDETFNKRAETGKHWMDDLDEALVMYNEPSLDFRF